MTFGGVAYLTLSVPNFLIAAFFIRYVSRNVPEWISLRFDPNAGAYAVENRVWIGAAALLVGVHLLGIQFRYVRSRSSESLSERFTDVVRSKGVGRFAVALTGSRFRRRRR